MERVKLVGEPEKAATWIWLEAETLNVEFYDHSQAAEQFFGNDIAYTLTVTGLTELYALTGQSAATLLPWLAGKFNSYFEIKRWLEAHAVHFGVQFESQA